MGTAEVRDSPGGTGRRSGHEHSGRGAAMETEMLAPQNDDLGREYTAALRRYLKHGGEAALARAYELGRQGLGEGRGVLSMVALHQEAMAELLAAPKGVNVLTPEAFARAGMFFTESMSPFEMTHRAFSEANAALHHMNHALEEELKRIAHALHDGAGQLLAAVHLSLDEVDRGLDPIGQGRLQVARKHLHDVYEQLRHLSHELRPTILDDLGLVPAIEFLSEGFARRSGLRVAVQSSNGVRLPVRLETVLYRVIQEALTNVSKHARATAVKIQFKISDKMVKCSITDDGVGFNTAPTEQHPNFHGLGLLGMKEKLQPFGGDLKIRSAPGQGTKLFITVPWRD
jgi:signal transduction histidine kinase